MQQGGRGLLLEEVDIDVRRWRGANCPDADQKVCQQQQPEADPADQVRPKEQPDRKYRGRGDAGVEGADVAVNGAEVVAPPVPPAGRRAQELEELKGETDAEHDQQRPRAHSGSRVREKKTPAAVRRIPAATQ